MVIVVVLTFIVLCVLCKQVAWSDLSYEHCGSWVCEAVGWLMAGEYSREAMETS
jgi:positive regulator of sigma E activity